MDRLEHLLTLALHRYGELLEILTALTGETGLEEGEPAPGLAARLLKCQESTRAVDLELLQILDEIPVPSRQLPMVREYQALLRRVAERNQLLLERARAYRALVAAELAELRGAKVAVAGYRVPIEPRGNRLSGRY